MAPLPEKTLHNLTHPNHTLVNHFDDQNYVCVCCQTSGTGSRLHCGACNVNFHQLCAFCTANVSSSTHQHNLTLVGSLRGRICDLCRGSLDGIFYHCSLCDFDLHPLCTQSPLPPPPPQRRTSRRRDFARKFAIPVALALVSALIGQDVTGLCPAV